MTDNNVIFPPPREKNANHLNNILKSVLFCRRLKKVGSLQILLTCVKD